MTAVSLEKPDTIENISNIDELKKFWIDTKWMEELVQPINVSRNELKKFKDEIDKLPEAEKLTRTKEFLKEKANTLLKSEQSQDKLKTETQKTIEAAAKKAQTWVEWAKEAAKDLETKAQTIVSEKWVVEMVQWLFKDAFAWLWALWTFFWNLFKSLLGMLWFGDKTKEITEKAKETVNEETQKKVELIQNNLKENKEEYTKRLQEKVPLNIAKKFWIDFQKEPEKLAKLKTLIAKSYGKIDEQKFIDLAEKMKDPTKEWLFVWDSFSSLEEIFSTSSYFMLGLIREWIIPPSKILIDIVQWWVDTIVITLNTIGQSVWIQNMISSEHFNKMIEWMSPEEKASTMAILYRKWWLFFSILWAIWWGSYKLVNAWLTPTSANWFRVMPQAMLNDYPKLIENFKNIEKSLWVEASKSMSPMLVEALENTKKIHMNYWLLEVLEKSWYKKNTFLKLIKDYPELEKKFPDLMEEVKNIPAWAKEAELLGQKVSNRMQSITVDKQWATKWIVWKFIQNQDGRLLNYSENLNEVSKMQKRLALENKWGFAKLAKIQESIHVAEVSRSGDRLMYSFKNEVDLKTWLKELNQAWPDIVRWVLWKLPIIALAWTSLASEDKIKTLKDEFWYLLPIVWPIMMISKAWVNEKWELVNFTDASIWAALFTMDSFHLIKWWWKWTASYIWRPVTDMFEIVRWSARFSYTTGKIIEKWVLKMAEEAATKLAKFWISPKMRYAFAAWMIAMVWYVAYKEYTDKPLSESEAKNALASNNVTKEEKEKATIALVQNSLDKFWFSNIPLNLKWNTIEINKNNLNGIKNIENTFVFDTIKETLEKQNLNWYNVKLV